MPRAKSPRNRKNISGARIKAARCSRAPYVTQAMLAQKMRRDGILMTQTGLALIEHHQRRVTDYELKSIARHLKTTVGWLCGDPGAKQ